MNYYLKQANLIKKISNQLNPQMIANQQINNTNKLLSVSNNQEVDYMNEARDLLSEFINDGQKLDTIINILNEDNDHYFKELVINWDKYQKLLLNLKGAVVSVRKIVDTLEDGLNEDLHKKTLIEKEIKPNTDTAQLMKIFFNGDKLKTDLEDSPDIVKRILIKLLDLSKSSNTKTIQRAIAEYDITKKDSIRSFGFYNECLGYKKSELISTIINEIFNALNRQKIKNINEDEDLDEDEKKERLDLEEEEMKSGNNNFHITLSLFKSFVIGVNKELNTHGLKEFDEDLESSKSFLSESDVKYLLQKCNMGFLNTFSKYSQHNLGDTIKNTDIEPIESKKSSYMDKALKYKEKDNTTFDKLLNEIVFSKIKEPKEKKQLKDYKIMFKLCIYFQLFDADEISILNRELSGLSNTESDKVKQEKDEIYDKCYDTVAQVITTYFHDNNIIYEYANNNADAINDLPNLLSIIGVSRTNQDIIYKKIAEIKERKEKKGYGIKSAKEIKGLKSHQKPINNKYYVDEKLLDNHGILEIRYIKNRHLAHVKPPILSLKGKKAVSDMINDRKINNDDFVSLTSFEKDLLRRINKLFDKDQNLNDDDDDKFTKSFELLKGEYMVGNNSQYIKDQLRAYIMHAVEIGKLSQFNGRKMLFELKLI